MRKGLSIRQLDALELLTTGTEVNEVARRLRLSPRLLHRWIKRNPRFQRCLAWAESGDFKFPLWFSFYRSTLDPSGELRLPGDPKSCATASSDIPEPTPTARSLTPVLDGLMDEMKGRLR
jgi:hypothetical protein